MTTRKLYRNGSNRIDSIVHREICDYIRNGGTQSKAAEAAGVPWQTFASWMRDPLYEDFQTSVKRAAARARLDAERRVWLEKPEQWLMRGPGRARADDPEPGWSDEIKIIATAVSREVNYDALTDAQLAALEGIHRTLLRTGNPDSVVEAQFAEVLSNVGSRLPDAQALAGSSEQAGSGSSGENKTADSVDATEARQEPDKHD